MQRTALVILALAAAMVITPTTAHGAQLAPDIESTGPDARIGIGGYGGNTLGGAMGRTIWVTSLADSGRGTLRAALEASGRRIVKFRVAGTIPLKGPIKIRSPYITVAGNVAPGQGVQIRGAPIIVVTHDVMLRYLRIRTGDAGLTSGEAADYDAVTLNGVGKNVYRVVLDHLSLLWGSDMGGLAVLGNVHDVTIQNSILGEGLRYSRHPEAQGGDGHSMAINVTPMRFGQTAPRRITFYHNLLTTSDVRMPRFVGASCVDFVNNLVYNWGSHAGSGNPRSMNLVNNWFRRGPLMKSGYMWWPRAATQAPTKFRDSVFPKGNRRDGFQGRLYPDGVVYAGSVRCGGLSVHISRTDWVFYDVLRLAGARKPVLDSVDRRVIRNVRYRVGGYFNGVEFATPHPYWPTLTP